MPTVPLSPTEFLEILSDHLVPMFPGSELHPSPIPEESTMTVLQESSNSLLVKPDVNWNYCFRLRRATHPFESDDLRIATQFTKALRQKLVAANQPFFRYLLEHCSQDAIAWSVQHRSTDDDLIPLILNMLRKWAAETYEGQRISVAIGIDPAPNPSRISNVHLRQLVEQDYAKVLSNGLDTILVLSPSGHVVEHMALQTDLDGFRRRSTFNYAPFRYLPLAEWCTGGRVAFSLNRLGEVLIFKSSQLQFAYRRGKWSHFAHAAMISRILGPARKDNIIRALYATCLDISFSRTGGCIAVSKAKNKTKWAKLLDDRDLVSLANNEKSALLSHLIGKPFYAIPRPIREEMAALDGAIVLDNRGTVIAAGAIVRVGGGSDGGGRRAAAKALSRLGLAVKVSADGGITAFTDKGTVKSPEIAFEVCK